MNDPSPLGLAHPFKNLLKYLQHLLLAHPNSILQRTILTVFVNKIDILFLNDQLPKFNHIGVIELCQYLHLPLKQLLQFLVFGELASSDYLYCYPLRLGRCVAPIDLAELTLTQQLSQFEYCIFCYESRGMLLHFKFNWANYKITNS